MLQLFQKPVPILVRNTRFLKPTRIQFTLRHQYSNYQHYQQSHEENFHSGHQQQQQQHEKKSFFKRIRCPPSLVITLAVALLSLRKDTLPIEIFVSPKALEEHKKRLKRKLFILISSYPILLFTTIFSKSWYLRHASLLFIAAITFYFSKTYLEGFASMYYNPHIPKQVQPISRDILGINSIGLIWSAFTLFTCTTNASFAFKSMAVAIQLLLTWPPYFYTTGLDVHKQWIGEYFKKENKMEELKWHLTDMIKLNKEKLIKGIALIQETMKRKVIGFQYSSVGAGRFFAGYGILPEQKIPMNNYDISNVNNNLLPKKEQVMELVEDEIGKVKTFGYFAWTKHILKSRKLYEITIKGNNFQKSGPCLMIACTFFVRNQRGIFKVQYSIVKELEDQKGLNITENDFSDFKLESVYITPCALQEATTESGFLRGTGLIAKKSSIRFAYEKPKNLIKK